MAKYRRNNHKTPSGGAYSEIYFLDELGNSVDEENAVRCVIRECSENGDLIAETWAFAEHCRENDNLNQKTIEAYMKLSDE